jgi:NAD(P)H-dependent FMN reductase
MAVKNVVILTGSCKRKISNSEVIADHIKELFAEHSVDAEVVNARTVIKENSYTDLFERVAEADLFFIVSPLYVDTISHELTVIFEAFYKKEQQQPGCFSGIKFAALSHGGFFGEEHHRVSMDILRSFAEEMQLECLGTLNATGTSIFDGKPLTEVKFFSRHVRKAAPLLVKALSAGREVPAHAKRTMRRKMIPLPLPLVIAAANRQMARE